MSHLIIVAYAVAPGPGGAEGIVNTRLLRALAEHWPFGVSVITAGGIPRLEDGTSLSDLPHWNFHTLGPHGGDGEDRTLLNSAAGWCLDQVNSRRIQKC